MTLVGENVDFAVGDVDSGVQDETTARAARAEQICHELSKMTGLDETVLDFRVTGTMGYCSPVEGNIEVITTNGDDVGNWQTVHPTRSREAIEDHTIWLDLNAMAKRWRAERNVPEQTRWR